MEEIRLNKGFGVFIKSLLKINDSAILSVDVDNITCLVGSPDSVSVVHGVFPCKSAYTGVLNISSILKLTKAIDQINADEFSLNVGGNTLEYKSPTLRFKYHLTENGIIGLPAVSLKKIASFVYDEEFDIRPEKLSELLKLSTFSSDSNKVYISCENGVVYANLTDKTRDNIDSIQFEITKHSSAFDGQPINMDFFRGLNYNAQCDIRVRLNTTIGVFCIEITSPTHKLKYITSVHQA